MSTISEVLVKSTNTLKQKNNRSPRLDAEVLLAHLMKVDRTYFLIHDAENLSQHIIEQYDELVSRRLHGEPIAYIVGHQEFMGLDFVVNKDVLIPRPDTEILVEYAIEVLNKDKVKNYHLLDIGTGSGAIGLSIAKYIPNSYVTVVDISKNALEVAKKNANRFGIVDKVEFIESDCFKEINNKKFDMILSNPPYISSLDIDSLQIEVSEFEPRGALDGGEDGLVFYRRIICEAKKYLVEKGILIFEIGYDQGEAVMDFMRDNGYEKIQKIKDLGGNDRVVYARLQRV